MAVPEGGTDDEKEKDIIGSALRSTAAVLRRLPERSAEGAEIGEQLRKFGERKELGSFKEL
jgi:hypothetical protein